MAAQTSRGFVGRGRDNSSEERDGNFTPRRQALTKSFLGRRTQSEKKNEPSSSIRVMARRFVAKRPLIRERPDSDQVSSSEDSASVFTQLSDESGSWVWAFDDLMSQIGSQISGVDDLLDALADDEEITRRENSLRRCQITVETHNSQYSSKSQPQKPCEVRSAQSYHGMVHQGYCTCVNTACLWETVQKSMGVDCIKEAPKAFQRMVKSRSIDNKGIKYQLHSREIGERHAGGVPVKQIEKEEDHIQPRRLQRRRPSGNMKKKPISKAGPSEKENKMRDQSSMNANKNDTDARSKKINMKLVETQWRWGSVQKNGRLPNSSRKVDTPPPVAEEERAKRGSVQDDGRLSNGSGKFDIPPRVAEEEKAKRGSVQDDGRLSNGSGKFDIPPRVAEEEKAKWGSFQNNGRLSNSSRKVDIPPQVAEEELAKHRMEVKKESPAKFDTCQDECQEGQELELDPSKLGKSTERPIMFPPLIARYLLGGKSTNRSGGGSNAETDGDVAQEPEPHSNNGESARDRTSDLEEVDFSYRRTQGGRTVPKSKGSTVAGLPRVLFPGRRHASTTHQCRPLLAKQGGSSEDMPLLGAREKDTSTLCPPERVECQSLASSSVQQLDAEPAPHQSPNQSPSKQSRSSGDTTLIEDWLSKHSQDSDPALKLQIMERFSTTKQPEMDNELEGLTIELQDSLDEGEKQIQMCILQDLSLLESHRASSQDSAYSGDAKPSQDSVDQGWTPQVRADQVNEERKSSFSFPGGEDESLWCAFNEMEQEEFEIASWHPSDIDREVSGWTHDVVKS